MIETLSEPSSCLRRMTRLTTAALGLQESGVPAFLHFRLREGRLALAWGIFKVTSPETWECSNLFGEAISLINGKVDAPC